MHSESTGHGRIEKRTTQVLPSSVLSKKHLQDWLGLDEGVIIKSTTESISKKTQKTSCLDRYFISSLNWNQPYIAEQCERAVRRHWAIENELHYVLDVDFFQDRTQSKNANYIQNRVLLNKMTLAIIHDQQKRESEESGKSPMSVKRYLARFATFEHALAALADITCAEIHA